jgi:hypothetical protein
MFSFTANWARLYYSCLRGCSMATSMLQIWNDHLLCRKLGFSFMCVLNHGTHSSFSKKIFWKQIRMSLLLEYNWNEPAVFTKHKHIILTWENSLKYRAWQLSFALSYKWCYNEKILKPWYSTMDDSSRKSKYDYLQEFVVHPVLHKLKRVMLISS